MTKFNFRYRKSVFTALLIALISAPMFFISCDKSLKEPAEPQATRMSQPKPQPIQPLSVENIAGPGDFVFSKIHVTGNKEEIDQWSDDTYFADQYIVIRNNSDVPKSIAGVSFGFTTHWNRYPYNSDKYQVIIDGLTRDSLVYVDCVYTFPATGNDLVQPGKEIILARTAKNHINVKEDIAPGVFDLSGAHYEVYGDPTVHEFFPYYPHESEENATNMIITRWYRNDMLGYGLAFAPPILFQSFKLDSTLNANQTYITRNSITDTVKIYGIPFKDILDGVETGSTKAGLVAKALPDSIDAGKILVPDFGENHVFVRKADPAKPGRLLYTRNSTNDFKIVQFSQPTYSSDNSN